MGRIIIKTVGGCKYRYERISTKRVGGTVKTKDKYLGPVEPAAKGMIERAPAKVRRNIEALYEAGLPVTTLIATLRDKAGIKVSESTVRNYMKREGVGRVGRWAKERSESAKEAWDKKRNAKAARQRKTAHRATVLLEEKQIKPQDVISMSRGIDEKTVNLLAVNVVIIS
jgi:hypothetical protein